jgi:hypothetical protein
VARIDRAHSLGDGVELYSELWSCWPFVRCASSRALRSALPRCPKMPGVRAPLTLFCSIFVAADLAPAHRAGGGIRIAGGIAGKSEGILLRCPVLPSLQRLGPIDGLRRSNPYQVSNKSRHYPARSKRVRALARIGGTKVAGRATRRRPQQAHAESVDCSASIRY